MQMYEEMMSINNEQTNALRMALKDQAQEGQNKTRHDSHYYDELSRLNNELANLQRELAKKNAELERLNRLKDQFLGMAAHDLRTPLGIIMGYSEFVIDEASEMLDEDHIEFLHIIRSSSNFMLQLVNDLLDISTIESGQLDIQLCPTDLGALVKHSVALNSVIAQSKQIELSFKQEDLLPSVRIDAARIDQVLNNLISNAIKYSFPESRVQVRLSRGDSSALIAVQDQGQGIPQQELDKLFQWFGKTRVKGTAGEKSTGLGLAISQRIVLSHGGKIWVESQVGRGSTFYVSLPLESSRDREQDASG
jgi:signal transduction histidine kinase